MKILLIDINIHHKNRNALLKYDTIHFDIIKNVEELSKLDLSMYICVMSPQVPIDISKYPNVFFIFGPHFTVFPNETLLNIKRTNVYYIQPSVWVLDFWKRYPICNGLQIKCLPFGVDTDRFNETKPIHKRDNIFIYYKNRYPNDLLLIENYLKTKGIPYKIFNYKEGYNENEYLSYLQNSKYGIWVGCSESQGFALEEALSCNIPLFVWNVTSIKQEYGQNYDDIPATTIPYWDENCGEYFYEYCELEDKFNLFLSKLHSYQPRKYIVENLSLKVCEKKLLELIFN
jgi:hypothetical protein